MEQSQSQWQLRCHRTALEGKQLPEVAPLEFAVLLCLSASKRTTTGANQRALPACPVCSSSEVKMPDVY